MNKHKTYRNKQKTGGYCPHCGKEPEAGYRECAARRKYKRDKRNKGIYKLVNMSRRTPRVGNVPIVYDKDFIWDMRNQKEEIIYDEWK